MRILVTGGLGFIGSHIVDLLAEDHSIHVVDNLSAGSMSNRHSLTEVSILDINDQEGMDRLFRDIRPEAVCHQAAQVSVGHSMRFPRQDAEVNLLGTLRILELCEAYRCRKLVFASSAAVYGDPLRLPVDEEHPTFPQSFYGLSKLAAEQAIGLFGKTRDMHCVILRYANVYGPRQKVEGEGGVVAIFASRMEQGLPCIIEGDGSQTRDFVHVSDVAEANRMALLHHGSFTANVSTGHEISVNGLFRTMAAVRNCRSEPVYRPPRLGDIARSCLDNTRIRNKLGWTPALLLKEGLKYQAT